MFTPLAMCRPGHPTFGKFLHASSFIPGATPARYPCLQNSCTNHSESVSTRYLSISSPASCFLLSHLVMRPRPDHVSFVAGSRYLTLTFVVARPASLPPAFTPRVNGVEFPACAIGGGASSSSSRFMYAMLLLVMPTSS